MLTPSLSHTVRFWRPGKDLGTRVTQKVSGVEGGMVEAVGFPGSMHSERPCHFRELALTGSKNAYVYSPTDGWNLLLHDELLQRQLVNIPSTSGYVPFEQTTPLPLLSTINHIRIAAFINTGQ